MVFVYVCVCECVCVSVCVCVYACVFVCDVFIFGFEFYFSHPLLCSTATPEITATLSFFPCYTLSLILTLTYADVASPLPGLAVLVRLLSSKPLLS